MRKVLILCVIILAFGSSLRANQITIVNQTGCDFSFSLRGLTNPPSTTQSFQSDELTFPPGTTAYPSPSAVPGLAGLPSTATFYYVKGYSLSSPTCTATVGSTIWPGGIPQLYNSAS